MKYADITLPKLETLFEKFNKEYFNGELQKPNFRIKTNKRQLGCCEVKHTVTNPYVNVTIVISNYYNVPSKDLEETMLHEMIHYMEYVKHKKMTHTKTFKEKADEINKLSKHRYNISRTTSRNGFELSNEGMIREQRAKAKKERIQILTVRV